MRVLLQRSTSSYVSISNKVEGKIDKGLVIFVAFTLGDNTSIINKMVSKIINLRIFDDEKGLMNYSLLDTNGEILSISQFTLYSNCIKGRRPSFASALEYNKAKLLYDEFNACLVKYNIKVSLGKFGSNMNVSINNSGPVTILLDSDQI
ncbi:MAG: D-aminoacyl-tRNA deacylase [Bacilli bacterium]